MNLPEISAIDVYELAEAIARKLEQSGESRLAAQIIGAMRMGSSGLENLGETWLVLTNLKQETLLRDA